VAIKLIAGAIASNEECIARFRREAEAMAMLHHPNTVRLFDFGVEQGELFMVMELLAGEDLSDYLTRQGALPLREALGILREVLQALCEAHARGIVHRDLKPANVFMSRVHGGQTFAKVMDFGIAGIEADSKTRLTLAGAVLGTPTYMSPEQAQGQPVDARSDLYSLGVMLFEMVTGSVPFAADSVVSLLLAQVSKAPPKLAEVRPDLARDHRLQGLLDRMLAKAPEQRPRDAAEVLAQVDELLQVLSSQPAMDPRANARALQEQAPTAYATPVAASGRGERAVAPASSFPGAASPQQRREKSLRVLALGAALLVATVAGLRALWPDDQAATAPATTLAASSAPTSNDAAPTSAPAAAPRGGTEGTESASPARARDDTREPDERASAIDSHDRRDNRPFPHLRNTLDKIFGGGGSGSGVSQSDRRQALLAKGPAYNNVASAKRAYRAGELGEQAYEDTIWVLKTRRARRIEAEKQNLRAGTISKEEYKRRVTRIDREYEGS